MRTQLKHYISLAIVLMAVVSFSVNVTYADSLWSGDTVAATSLFVDKPIPDFKEKFLVLELQNITGHRSWIRPKLCLVASIKSHPRRPTTAQT